MNLSQELMLKCPFEAHNSLVKFVCFNEFCPNNRIYCFECLKKGDHTAHTQDQYELNKLFEFFENQKEKFKELIQLIKVINDNITESLVQLQKVFQMKCQLSTSDLSKSDANKLSQSINQMIKYKDITNNIRKDINNSSKALIDSINKYKNEFRLDEYDQQKLDQQKIEQVKELFQQGEKLFYGEHKFNEAKQYFNKALQIKPNDMKCLHLTAECLKMLGYYDDAIILIDKALQIDSNNLLQLFTKIEVLRGLKKYEDAILWADKALSINSTHLQSIITKADSLKMIGQYDEAIVWANKALQLDSMNLNSFIIKAGCLKMIGQYDEAIIWANKALQLDSNDLCTLITKAESLKLLGKHTEAIECANKGLQINPRDVILEQLKRNCQFTNIGQSIPALSKNSQTNKTLPKSINGEKNGFFKSIQNKNMK